MKNGRHIKSKSDYLAHVKRKGERRAEDNRRRKERRQFTEGVQAQGFWE